MFENNVFYGNHEGLPAEPHAIRDTPPLIDAGSGDYRLVSLGGYQLREPAPQFAGKLIEANGGRDFFGNPVPQDTAPFIGVHQPRD